MLIAYDKSIINDRESFEGKTALPLVIEASRYEVAEHLLSHNADTGVAGKNLWTPLVLS
jgi:ankyrin repeat protein